MMNYKFMDNRNFTVAMLIFCTLVCGCGDGRNETQKAIKELEREFAIPWPKQIVSEYGWSLSTVRSTDVYVRFDVDKDTFNAWRVSVTNILEEVPGNGLVASKGDAIEARFSWWDCQGLPGDRFVFYRNDIRAGSSVPGLLQIMVLSTNNLDVMYIHGVR